MFLTAKTGLEIDAKRAISSYLASCNDISSTTVSYEVDFAVNVSRASGVAELRASRWDLERASENNAMTGVAKLEKKSLPNSISASGRCSLGNDGWCGARHAPVPHAGHVQAPQATRMACRTAARADITST